MWNMQKYEKVCQDETPISTGEILLSWVRFKFS